MPPDRAKKIVTLAVNGAAGACNADLDALERQELAEVEAEAAAQAEADARARQDAEAADADRETRRREAAKAAAALERFDREEAAG